MWREHGELFTLPDTERCVSLRPRHPCVSRPCNLIARAGPHPAIYLDSFSWCKKNPGSIIHRHILPAIITTEGGVYRQEKKSNWFERKIQFEQNFQNNYQVTRGEKKVMTGAVNRIPGRFKIWSALSLAPSLAPPDVSCDHGSWEEESSWAGSGHQPGSGAMVAWPCPDLRRIPPGASDAGTVDTVIAAREKLTDGMREAKLYKIMLITWERDEMRGKWTNVCWNVFSVTLDLVCNNANRISVWVKVLFPPKTLLYWP